MQSICECTMGRQGAAMTKELVNINTIVFHIYTQVT
jgi:hypothetical protein